MPIIDLDAQIQSSDASPEVKSVLRQMHAALNHLFDTKSIFDDVQVNGKIIMLRQGEGDTTGDGKEVEFFPSGVGSSTATFKERG